MFQKFLDADKMDSYQLVQYKHDVSYHPEILSLGVVGRIKHIVLHFMKYRAKLSQYSKDSQENKIAVVDTFIMLASSCNALGIRISQEIIQHEEKEIDFLEEYIQLLGKMAKATESADHQEDYSINKEWKNCVIALLRLVLYESISRKLNIIDESIIRLKSVEENHSLHFMLKEIA